MSNNTTISNLIKTRLEALSNLKGNVYIAVPPDITNEAEVKKYLTAKATGQLDVWFVTRRRVSTLKYGESRYKISTRQRAKEHHYMIRGFQSVLKDKKDGKTSEEIFQDLIDDIENDLATSVSLAISTHTVFCGSFSADIAYENFGETLSHSVDINYVVVEYLQTSYEV